MAAADEKRIAAAQEIVEVRFRAALAGCPADMGCGIWIDRHAVPALREAYRAAIERRTAAEQSAIDRGTHYRGTFGTVYRIR